MAKEQNKFSINRPAGLTLTEVAQRTPKPPAFEWAIFNGYRYQTNSSNPVDTTHQDGRMYTGHLLNTDGTSDSTQKIQFRILNDLGKETLPPLNGKIIVVEAETWDTQYFWTDTETWGEKYICISWGPIATWYN